MGNSNTELKPATIRIIESIKSEEIRSLLLKGLDPKQTVEGWYYSLALNIWKLQEGRK